MGTLPLAAHAMSLPQLLFKGRTATLGLALLPGVALFAMLCLYRQQKSVLRTWGWYVPVWLPRPVGFEYAVPMGDAARFGSGWFGAGCCNFPGDGWERLRWR